MNKYGIIILCLTLTLLNFSCKTKENKAAINLTPKSDSSITINLNSISQAPMNEEGLNTDFYDNGKEKMKGIIKDGQREGLWQAWYENGNLWSEAEYKKGINYGKSITYYENGKVRYEGKYVNGKKIGDWNYYDEQGKLVKTIKN